MALSLVARSQLLELRILLCYLLIKLTFHCVIVAPPEPGTATSFTHPSYEAPASKAVQTDELIYNSGQLPRNANGEPRVKQVVVAESRGSTSVLVHMRSTQRRPQRQTPEEGTN